MKVIAYTYEAGTHCPDCARKRFGAALDDPEIVDSEGNPIHPVFDTDEQPVEGVYCDCGEEIVPPTIMYDGEEYYD